MGCDIIPHINRKENMENRQYRQATVDSLKRDTEVLKLIGGVQTNIKQLKEILDHLEWRIKRLESKND